MSEELRKLIDKKQRWGVLSGRDALLFWRHVQASVDGGSRDWAQRDFEQLTRWQFGLRTTTQFRVVAGPAGAQVPECREVVLFRPLLRRKYTSLAERETVRKAKRAAVMARLRLRKAAK